MKHRHGNGHDMTVTLQHENLKNSGHNTTWTQMYQKIFFPIIINFMSP